MHDLSGGVVPRFGSVCGFQNRPRILRQRISGRRTAGASWGCAVARTAPGSAPPFLTRKPDPGPTWRDFASPVSTYEFVDDIAYLWTGEGVLCPFTVIGLNGRIVVGWSLSERMAVDIVASAESRGCVVVNAIFNADSKNVARRFCSNRNGAVSCSQDRIAAS